MNRWFLKLTATLALAITFAFSPAFSYANNAKDIVPSATPGPNNAFGLSASPVAWMTVLLLWVVALYLLTRMPGLEALRLGKNGRNSDCAH